MPDTSPNPASRQMSYKARKRWSLVLLLVGMPIYIIVVLNLMSSIARLPFLAELVAYVVLGTVWILPFKRLFLGVGQPDPNAGPDAGPNGGSH